MIIIRCSIILQYYVALDYGALCNIALRYVAFNGCVK